MDLGTVLQALGWPHFVFLFALVCLLLFRPQLAGLLGRITSIDKSGIKAFPTPEAQREEKKNEAALELLEAIGSSIVLRDVEGLIHQELGNCGLETSGDTVKVLIKQLAATRILVEFEQIHNFIFGSQIFLLKRLNEVAGQGKPKQFVDDYFIDLQVKVFPEAFGNWTADQYLGFLHQRLLILLKDGTYHITNLGVEYLTWMARNGRSENNPL